MNEQDLRGTLLTIAAGAPECANAAQLAVAAGRRRSRRRRAVAVGGMAAALVAGAGVWQLTLSQRAAIPAGPVPNASTSVEQTARTYLIAATTGDCAMTKALTEPGTSKASAWCTNPRMLSYSDVKVPEHVSASEAGVDEECVGFTMRSTGTDDQALPAGTLPWSLCFVRTPAGWRVHDQGQA